MSSSSSSKTRSGRRTKSSPKGRLTNLVRRNWIVAFFLLIVPITLSASLYPVLFAPQAASPLENMSVKTDGTTRELRVLDVRYFPPNSANNAAKVDPLSQDLKNLMENGSAPKKYQSPNAVSQISVNIVRTLNRNGFSPNNGSPDRSYENSIYSLRKMFEEPFSGENKTICQLVREQDIDQVWIWVDPTTDLHGFKDEFHWIYSDFLQQNKNADKICGGESTFLAMSLEQNIPAEYAFHSFGHASESLITDLQRDHLFNRNWTGTKGAGFICGDVHFPPNGTADYNYDNPNQVTTVCSNWNLQNNEPRGNVTTVTCQNWGCSQKGYLLWWFQNMPSRTSNNMYQGRRVPGWWDLFVDTDDSVSELAGKNYYFSQVGVAVARPENVSAISTQQSGRGTSLRLTHSVASSNTVILTWVTYRGETNKVGSVKYGSQSLEKLAEEAGNEYVTQVWYLAQPAQGTNPIDITWTEQREDIHATALTVTKVDFNRLTGLPKVVANAADITDGSNSIGTELVLPISANDNEVIIGGAHSFSGGDNQFVFPAEITPFANKVVDPNGKFSLFTVNGRKNGISFQSTARHPWSVVGVVLPSIAGATTSPTPTPTPNTNPPTPSPTPKGTPQPTVTPSPRPETSIVNPAFTSGNGLKTIQVITDGGQIGRNELPRKLNLRVAIRDYRDNYHSVRIVLKHLKTNSVAKRNIKKNDLQDYLLYKKGLSLQNLKKGNYELTVIIRDANKKPLHTETFNFRVVKSISAGSLNAFEFPELGDITTELELDPGEAALE